MRKLDLTGQTFGKLTVVDRAETLAGGRTRWNCVCSCGRSVVVRTGDLTSGNTRSCGCGHLEGAKKRGEAQRGRSRGPLMDLTGKRFGRLVVLGLSRRGEDGTYFWQCRCDCGAETEARGDTLRGGQTRSCGCLAHDVRVGIGRSSAGRISSRRLDLAGKVFGRLTVLEAVPRYKKPLQWRCRCECGKETLVVTSKLTTGKTKSCGCLGLENATKAKIRHGETHSKLYNVWCAMRNRCERPSCTGWKWYGGKGVTVCDEWHDFSAFKSWATAHGYAEGLTIDRIDSDGNYCPENCRWVTLAENISRAHKGRSNKRN